MSDSFYSEGLAYAGKYSDNLFGAAVCGLLIGVERREKMQVTEPAVGLTDGKGDLVRLYDWLEQRKITVREIALKRQEGNSVKSCCTLPCRGISIKRISCGCRRISRVCSRLRYKRNSKAVRQKCWTAFVLDE